MPVRDNRGNPLPDAWLVLAKYGNGVVLEHGIFPSRKEAEAYRSEQNPRSWADSPELVVEKDRPERRFRLDSMCLRTSPDLTVRHNWLARHRQALAGCLLEPRTTQVFTYDREGEPEDHFAARELGGSPLPAGMAWPACPRCGKPTVFVGSLDFRGTEERAHVPGDSLLFHYCFDCAADGEPGQHAFVWIRDGDKLKVQRPAPPRPARPGRRWAVTDYSWAALRAAEIEDPDLGGDRCLWEITCHATKIGGHPFWLQEPQVPRCACRGGLGLRGKPMRFIGQFLAPYTPDMELSFGDSGIVYVFHCATGKCGRTSMVEQCG